MTYKSKNFEFGNVRFFCLKLPNSPRKPIKKFTFQNLNTSRCKIQNVRARPQNLLSVPEKKNFMPPILDDQGL